VQARAKADEAVAEATAAARAVAAASAAAAATPSPHRSTRHSRTEELRRIALLSFRSTLRAGRMERAIARALLAQGATVPTAVQA